MLLAYDRKGSKKDGQMKTRIITIKAEIKAEDDQTTKEMAGTLEKAVTAWIEWWGMKKVKGGSITTHVNVEVPKGKSRARAK